VRAATACGQGGADKKRQNADEAVHPTFYTSPPPQLSQFDDARLGQCSGMAPEDVTETRSAAYNEMR
jgi:hypothetical protein